jgi:hypothetical protein
VLFAARGLRVGLASPPIPATHAQTNARYPGGSRRKLKRKWQARLDVSRYGRSLPRMRSSDRIFAIELRNRGRVRRGTATVWRWVAILEAIKRRHAGASISPKYTWRITVRSRKAGPVVVTCKATGRSSSARPA